MERWYKPSQLQLGDKDTGKGPGTVRGITRTQLCWGQHGGLEKGEMARSPPGPSGGGQFLHREEGRAWG